MRGDKLKDRLMTFLIFLLTTSIFISKSYGELKSDSIKSFVEPIYEKESKNCYHKIIIKNKNDLDKKGITKYIIDIYERIDITADNFRAKIVNFKDSLLLGNYLYYDIENGTNKIRYLSNNNKYYEYMKSIDNINFNEYYKFEDFYLNHEYLICIKGLNSSNDEIAYPSFNDLIKIKYDGLFVIKKSYSINQFLNDKLNALCLLVMTLFFIYDIFLYYYWYKNISLNQYSILILFIAISFIVIGYVKTINFNIFTFIIIILIGIYCFLWFQCKIIKVIEFKNMENILNTFINMLKQNNLTEAKKIINDNIYMNKNETYLFNELLVTYEMKEKCNIIEIKKSFKNTINEYCNNKLFNIDYNYNILKNYSKANNQYPMMGFCGTVIGLIWNFGKSSSNEVINFFQNGLDVALYTTYLGIVFALISLFIENKITHLIEEFELHLNIAINKLF